MCGTEYIRAFSCFQVFLSVLVIAMEDKENVRGEDAMNVDIFPSQESQQVTQDVKEGEKGKKKSLKRKRNFLINVNDDDFNKHSVLCQCQKELDSLFLYFKDSLVPKLNLEDCDGCSNNQSIACLMEGSNLSLLKLAEEIFTKIGMREGVTVEMVRRELPFVGSRVKYGVDNGNLNLGEDESETCLWCWEVIINSTYYCLLVLSFLNFLFINIVFF